MSKNKVLAKQLSRLGLSEDALPQNKESWQKFLQAIDSYYSQCEEDRYLLERSMEISSKEMKERLEANKEMSFQLAQAAKMSAMGVFSAGIAHELNNPLQIINSSAELAIMSLQKKKPEAAKDYNYKILNITQKMAKTIKHLLKLSRNESEDSFEIVSIENIVKDSMELMENQLKKTQISIFYEFPESPLMVNASATQLYGIIQNLVNNSRDAFKSNINDERLNYIKISAIVSKENPKQLELFFEDNAGGIPEDILANIFDPFFTTKDVNSGTGLGLALAKKTLENLKGDISVSVIDQTTSFKITLPLFEESKEVSSISRIDITEASFKKQAS